MDGFFVSKFKVEKRTKAQSAPVDVEMKEPVDEAVDQEESAGFDSEEDRPYLEGSLLVLLKDDYILTLFFAEAKRRRMKAKGLRVPPRNKAGPRLIRAKA